MASAQKVLVTGPAKSLKQWATKLTTMQTKHSFDLVLAMDLFSDLDNDSIELAELLAGKITIPVQVYVAVGGGALPEKVRAKVAAGEEVCSNLMVLGKLMVGRGNVAGTTLTARTNLCRQVRTAHARFWFACWNVRRKLRRLACCSRRGRSRTCRLFVLYRRSFTDADSAASTGGPTSPPRQLHRRRHQHLPFPPHSYSHTQLIPASSSHSHSRHSSHPLTSLLALSALR